MDRKYNVYEGRKPGLYDSWEEAKAQVDGYPGNCHERVKPSGESFSKPYVVTEGKTPGVYDKWAEAHEQVSGYPGGKVVKAKSFADAESQFQASQGSSKKHGY